MCRPRRRCYAHPTPPFPLPPGFAFVPRDDQLINEYLKMKINNQPVNPHIPIHTVNLYSQSPRELTDAYPNRGDHLRYWYPTKDKEWYFFTRRDRKRLYRAAGNGYWKFHGAKKQIIHNNIRIGYKNSLVFYQGKPPKGKETIWDMKEYILDQLPTQQSARMHPQNFVACRITMRTGRRRNQSKQLLLSFSKLRIGKATNFLNVRSKQVAHKRV